MQDWIENVLRHKIIALDDQPRRPYEWAGDAYRALAFSELFWPDVHVVRGATFLALGDNADVREIEASLNHAATSGVDALRQEIDRLNCFEIPDFFAEAEDPLDPDIEIAYRELAITLKSTWSARLNTAQPGKTFELTVVEPYGGVGISIVICQ